MRIWLFLETLRPLTWGIRYGGHWRVVKHVTVQIPMETRGGRCAPHGYLYGRGEVRFIGDGAVICARLRAGRHE